MHGPMNVKQHCFYVDGTTDVLCVGHLMLITIVMFLKHFLLLQRTVP